MRKSFNLGMEVVLLIGCAEAGEEMLFQKRDMTYFAIGLLDLNSEMCIEKGQKNLIFAN